MTLCLGMLTITFLVWAIYLFDQRMIYLIAGIAGAILTIFFFSFFRDPKRNIPAGENILVAPADGKIVAIKKLDSQPFLNSSAVQISIFLSPLDVHINRIPTSGIIAYVQYKKGSFRAAYKDSASEENEQTEIGLITDNGNMLVFKQIAGHLARRIVCRLKKDQKVFTGEKFGMIKFGSRTDLIVPADTEIDVKLEQQVTGGETIIGRLNPVTSQSSAAVSSTQTDA